MNQNRAEQSQSQSQARSRLLLPTVFLAGVGTLGIEMVMPRLLAPYVGTSQPIWAVVIGLTLVYLAIGYHVGGRLADQWPDERLLYRLIAWAGLLCGGIPLVSHPVLNAAQQALSDISAGGFLAALVAVLLLFAAPVILLATVGPFAVRLQLHAAAEGVEAAGRTAGTISSLSTLGSIVGAFLPVLVFIPWIGTQRTLYLLAGFLIVVGMVGLREWRYWWMLVVVGSLAYYTLTTQAGVRAATCYRCAVIYETESRYNYIQVVLQEYAGENGVPDMRLNLVLNEGHAIHSSYRLKYEQTGNPLDLLTEGPWDYFAVAPYFFPQRDPQSVNRVALLGSAVGTIPKQMLAIYGPQMHIDAVEIDPRILAVGREYFAMEDQDPRYPNYTTYAQDARYWLETTSGGEYDIIGMDAYHQPYIPFHLTTVEFFQAAKAHLSERGVMVVNAGRPPGGDTRLEDAIATTMRAVFPQVFLMDTRLPRSSSAIIVGVKQPVGDGVANFHENAERIESPALRRVMAWARFEGRGPVREFLPEQATVEPFTDDRAPVEHLIDSLIVSEVEELSR